MTIDAVEEITMCGTNVPQYVEVETDLPTNSINTDMRRITGDMFTTFNSYQDPTLLNKKYFLFWNDISRFIFLESNEWEYRDGGGFNVLIPGFNAQGQTLVLTIDNN